MATDLKVSVKREIDRLRKELDTATGRLAAFQEEIKRHELVHDMLDGRKIDWTGVFATLPARFTLDSPCSPTRRRVTNREATSGRWSRGG